MVRARLCDGQILVNQIVHLPELALHSCCFSGAGGGERMLVIWHQGKLAEDDLQLVAKLVVHLHENRMKYPARRAFEVAKLFKRYLCVSWTKYVWWLRARRNICAGVSR